MVAFISKNSVNDISTSDVGYIFRFRNFELVRHLSLTLIGFNR